MLHDLEPVVVDAGDPRVRQPARDAAVVQVEVLGAVLGRGGVVAAAEEADLRARIDGPQLRALREGRQPAVRRIDNQRGAVRGILRVLVPVRRSAVGELAPGHLRLVVAQQPGLAGRPLGVLLGGQLRARAERFRTLQRHRPHHVRRPHALQVRVAPGRAERFRRARRGLPLSRLPMYGRRRQAHQGAQAAGRRTGQDHPSIRHRYSPVERRLDSAAHQRRGACSAPQRRCPYSSSSANGMHLNSRSCMPASMRRYNGRLIFHGRVNVCGSSIVAS